MSRLRCRDRARRITKREIHGGMSFNLHRCLDHDGRGRNVDTAIDRASQRNGPCRCARNSAFRGPLQRTRTPPREPDIPLASPFLSHVSAPISVPVGQLLGSIKRTASSSMPAREKRTTSIRTRQNSACGDQTKGALDTAQGADRSPLVFATDMNCARLRLNADTTTIFIREGWLIVEAADGDLLREQLANADGSRLLGVADISRRTGFTAGAVRGWIKRGVLAAVRVGKEYRVREAELAKLLAGDAISSPSTARRIGRRRKPVVV